MNSLTYPDRLEVRPYAGPPLSASVTVPGSKSITNRALVLAALASREWPCTLTGALRSEDTEVMVDSLDRLGFDVRADWRHDTIRIGKNSTGRVIPAEYEGLFVANSGTSMRFLCAMVSLGTGPYVLDGVQRMRERPIEDLIAALRQLCVMVQTPGLAGRRLVQITGGGWRTSSARLRAGLSSQFLSGLMM